MTWCLRGGAEEYGLLGSYEFVNALKEETGGPYGLTLDDIGFNLNFDMVGDPNYVLAIYDGRNAQDYTNPPVEEEVAAMSGRVQELFEAHFEANDLPSEPSYLFAGEAHVHARVYFLRLFSS